VGAWRVSFVSRQIDVTITLGTGDFGEGKGNTVTLSGYQVSANIQKFGNPTTDAAEIRIYGLSATLLNTLSRLGKPLQYERTNTITVSAGDAVAGMSTVYTGIMWDSYGDFDASPDVCLFVAAFQNTINSAAPVAPLSFAPGASVAVIAAQIASVMGLGFINDGVSATLPGSFYAAGSAQGQLDKLQQAGNFNYITTGGTGSSLEIWPKGGSRGAMGPLISPSTGMVGYPKYSDAGIEVRALYMPGMGVGTPFQLQSSLTGAVGLWYVLSISLELEANNPTGGDAWFMDITGQRAIYSA
jgi:hypothetical protein